MVHGQVQGVVYSFLCIPTPCRSVLAVDDVFSDHGLVSVHGNVLDDDVLLTSAMMPVEVSDSMATVRAALSASANICF